jgi:hypothetical protein
VNELGEERRRDALAELVVEGGVRAAEELVELAFGRDVKRNAGGTCGREYLRHGGLDRRAAACSHDDEQVGSIRADGLVELGLDRGEAPLECRKATGSHGEGRGPDEAALVEDGVAGESRMGKEAEDTKRALAWRSGGHDRRRAGP